ncbi:MAG: cyclic nucleotide-binding domain-containing protein, partial [Planctomycetes bacterium]|nr:cyclic nucleotide-binding domain-containing protein [Planctomycetota bacterium]
MPRASRAMSADYPTEWSFAGVLVRLYAALCETESPRPDVFGFLAGYSQATARQKADVLLFDQFRCWRDGEKRPAESYFEQFPDFAAEDLLRLELILEEFAYRQDAGEDPQPQDFAARFPDLADELRQLLPDRGGRPRYAEQAEVLQHVADREALSKTGPLGASTILYRDDTCFNETVDAFSAPVPQSSLTGCAPFSSLPRHVVQLLESHMREQRFRAGSYLMEQGEPGDSLMVLLEGEIEVSTDDVEGGRTLITQSKRVQVLGEMSLLTDEPRSANVRALGPCRALSLPAARFHELAARYPAISVVLTLLIAKRLGRPDRTDVLRGKTLDGYRILERLGRGGMAVVYAAEELATGRRVALKMMSHRLVYDDAALEQFQREADIIESFEHPNIVRMYGRFAA